MIIGSVFKPRFASSSKPSREGLTSIRTGKQDLQELVERRASKWAEEGGKNRTFLQEMFLSEVSHVSE